MDISEQRCSKCGCSDLKLNAGVCESCRLQDHATIPPGRQPKKTPRNSPTIIPDHSENVGASKTCDQFGDYELLHEIARGGMGVVYKARHKKLNRVSALKMILGGRFSSAEDLQRFQIEASSAAKLDHPGIVPIYEIGECEGQAFYSMKYVDGGTLADQISRFQCDPYSAAKLIAKVARAVFHAHQRGILHRDLKPANILLDMKCEPLVTDLGLAKSTSGGSNLTHTGAVVGTPSYMPKEQAAGGTVTIAADIYALGAIFYELLVGRPPFKGDSTVEVLMQVVESSVPSPRKFNPDIDPDLELICMKCLEQHPDDRYSTALAFANDVEAWLEGKPISVKPPSFSDGCQRWMKKNRRAVYAGFAILSAMLICMVPIFSFLSDDVMQIYDHFPSERKPWLISLAVVPKWVSVVALWFLITVLWPALGFINNALSRPRNWRSAVLFGIGTSAVVSFVFYLCLGWLVFSQGANNISNDKIRVLTCAVWPNKESEKQACVEKANRMFEGLEFVPIEERSEVVRQRIKADIYAVAPTSMLALLGFCLLMAGPVIYGTTIAYFIGSQKNPAWLAIARYLVGWWSVTGMVVLSIVTFGTSENNAIFRRMPALTMIVFAVLFALAFLTMRKWKVLACSSENNSAATVQQN